MSPAREAIYLPLAFLTVVLLGALRPGSPAVLVAPAPFGLVLALILIGALVRCGALAPERLMNASRGALANMNGLVVLATRCVASAQAFTLATPDSGVPRVVFGVFLLILLLNTLAAAPDRVRLLRSLMVIFGSAFTLKFVVLAALSDPAGGALKRVLLAALEGLTLGTLTQDVLHPSAAYLGFFVLLLFLAGLAALPGVEDPQLPRRGMPGRRELPRRSAPGRITASHE
jgi:hypothetical protein